ncbi:MAG TPA: hypothetical protein VE262_18460 [Blastocatellia bacterium]|nr:hypothetical protein [Blastocatellia bacterium]
MIRRDGEWINALSSGDADILWTKLYSLISKHSSIKSLYAANRFSHDRLKDIYCDLTQDLFLILYEKDRLQFYLNAGYTDENVEQELYRIEVPNLVSQLLRERYPESYRLARRTSILLQTRPEFNYFPRPHRFSDSPDAPAATRGSLKLVAKVYGLSSWSPSKPIKNEQQMAEMAKEVAVRTRDNRRSGRGGHSQVIISNDDLCELIVDIFTAIDSPCDVRTMRNMVLSKLAVEDIRFLSIDAEIARETSSEMDSLNVDLADARPTPEEVLLSKETSLLVNDMAARLMESMWKAVRGKPHRYQKLVRVAWHCYFDPSSPSQTSVAEMMGISNSLVSHYRKIFDGLIQEIELSDEEGVLLDGALGSKLEAVINEMPAARGQKKARAKDGPPSDRTRSYLVAPRHMTAAASGSNGGRLSRH